VLGNITEKCTPHDHFHVKDIGAKSRKHNILKPFRPSKTVHHLLARKNTGSNWPAQNAQSKPKDGEVQQGHDESGSNKRSTILRAEVFLNSLGSTPSSKVVSW
jgi:hypothetical protein